MTRDVRRLAKRWQTINGLAAARPSAHRPMGQGVAGSAEGQTAGVRKLPPGIARTARAAGIAVACALLAAVTVFSVYPIPVTANATALAGPGTGGIKASVSLLRFELRFAKGGTIARRHFEEAEKAFSAGEFADAAGLYELSGEAVDTLAAKLNFGIAVYNSSDLPKAASILASGVQIARQKHMAILEAAFLTNLGNVRRDQGHLDEAARLYGDAERVDRGADALGSAIIAYDYGLLCAKRGNFSEALSQFDIARQGYQRLGNKLGEANALLHGLETASNAPEDLRAAAQLYQQIPGPLAEATYHFAVGYRESLEGTHHRDEASAQLAVDEFNRAYGIYKGIGYRRGQGAVMCALGNAYRAQSNAPEAAASYSKCLSLATEIGNPFLRALGLTLLGRQDITSGKPSDGLEKLTLALQVAQEIGARFLEISALNEIGGEYARRGEPRQAQGYYEKAVNTAEETGDGYLLIQPLRSIAGNYRRLGDVAGARGALVRLRDLYVAAGNTTGSAKVQREIDQIGK